MNCYHQFSLPTVDAVLFGDVSVNIEGGILSIFGVEFFRRGLSFRIQHVAQHHLQSYSNLSVFRYRL